MIFGVRVGYAVRMISVRARVSLLVGVLLAGTVVAVSAHLKVEKTFPESGATIELAPKELRVWFSQSPTLPVSGLALEGPGGKVEVGKVAAGQTDGKADHSLVAAISGTLAPGKYTASWKTSGSDGHILTGTFEFTLKTPQ
jgi:methionine-rich copper-binding protein CopC